MARAGFLSDGPLVPAVLASGAEAAGDAANYYFQDAGGNGFGVRVCMVANRTGGLLLVRVNSAPTAGVNEASLTRYDFIVLDDTSMDICLEAELQIKNLSIWIIGADATQLEVNGLPMARGA